MINVRRFAAIVSLSALVLAGCGSDDNSAGSASATGNAATIENCTTGTISGAGSTFVQTLAQQWTSSYQNGCPGATVNYQGVGSSAGIQQLLAGTVDFAGSDVPLSSAEMEQAKAKYQNVVELPWSAGGIAIEYNLPSVPNVKLAPSTLAKIFTGAIKTWNDPIIAADNSGVSLPSTPIQVVHRSDGSGTTAAFTSFLSAAAPDDWKAGSGKEIAWPTGQGSKGSDGVTAAVKATEGAISYAEVSYAKTNQLGIALVQNASGNFTGPEATNVTAALTDAKIDSNNVVTMDYVGKSAQSYPISTVTYAIMPKAPADATKAKLLKSFVGYALGNGQGAASPLYYAALPNNMLSPAAKAADTIGAAN